MRDRFADILNFIPTPSDLRIHMQNPAALDQSVNDLIQRAAQGNAAFMNGDMSRWLSFISHGPDFSIMSPFGGWTTNGFDAAPERLDAMARYFQSGTTDLEVIATYASADLIVLAVVERQRAVVGHLPEQDWSLRVTLVYRRTETGWDQVHRHADPLVKPITLEELSAMAG
jgi:ketosteroid isomerase-like protein